MKILVINAGSSSLKYQLFDMDTEEVLAKGNCERIGIDGKISGKNNKGVEFKKEVPMKDHTEAFNYVVEALTQGDAKVIDSMDEISAAGHRIVQGGSIFSKSILVDDKVIEDIEGLAELAPLHNLAHGMGLRACKKILPNIPQVVVFDTAFHQTMPPEAYIYGVPYEYYEKYKIRRYGFHGTSHRFVSGECYKELGIPKDNSKIITCHLGNGSSITAIKDGKVIDTSMGFTPLDGFIMGTRSGTLDPSVVAYICDKEHLNGTQLSELFNKKSGVLGISGISSDERDIDDAIEAGNERAILARTILCYQITKFIGGYIAALNGLDAIVFTGGIGENTPQIRQYVAEHLEYMGVKLDYEANERNIHGVTGLISAKDSKIPLTVIATNEELVIARDTKEIVENL